MQDVLLVGLRGPNLNGKKVSVKERALRLPQYAERMFFLRNHMGEYRQDWHERRSTSQLEEM